MTAKHAYGFVKLSTEIADLACILLHRLLLPSVRNGPQQRNERRRARRDHVLLDTELDELGIVLERGAEEHLARKKHHNEIGTGLYVRGVALRGKLRHMRAYLPRVLAEQRLPARLVGRFERFQVRVERRLRDDDVLTAWQTDDDVRPHPAIAIAVGDRMLLDEVAMLHHAGQLDDAFELQLAPSATDAGTFERVDQFSGLTAQILAGRIERRDPLQQLRARLDTTSLALPELAVDVAECARHRLEQMLDGRLALVDFSCRRRADLAQLRLGQREECFVVALERFVAQRPEGIADGIAQRGVVRGSRHDPTEEDAKTQKENTTDERGYQQCEIDGHEYRIQWSVISGGWSVVGASPSPDHKRQPRLRKLQLCRMDATCTQAGPELLQRVTSGDLRATSLVDESSGADAQLLTRRRALGFQLIEATAVDRFERQAELKTLG